MRAARGEYRKSAARRDQIVDSALRVFAENGYTAGSISEIAKAVGLTAPGVTHHFAGGKPALLAAVLEQRDLIDIERIERRSGRDLLRGLVEISRAQSEVPGLVKVHLVLAAEATEPDHPARATFERRFSNILTTIERAFAEIERDGGLRAGVTARTAAISTVASIEGLSLLWLYGVEIDLAVDLERHIGSLLREPLI